MEVRMFQILQFNIVIKMKSLFIIAFLLFTVSCLKAQTSLLGEQKIIVIATLKYNNITNIDSGITDNKKMTFVHYKNKTETDIYYYFNLGDTCAIFAERFWKKEYLIPAIEDLNKNNKNIGSYEWIDKDAKFNISLGIFDDGFSILYKRL